MPKLVKGKAVFNNQIKMPYNECESCERTYVVINVMEYEDPFDGMELKKPQAWIYQECTICPYCGYDSSKQTIRGDAE